MAVATLERKTGENKEELVPQTYRTPQALSDEAHNARIRDNFARLINPENKIEDLFAQATAAEKASASVQAEQMDLRPYLVENARADAAIFRADNAVNRISDSVSVSANASAVVEQAEEEENEDLRPTKTTIQYRTIGVNDNRKVKETAEKHGQILGKREKIIIATFVGLVVVLFSLVIINSAIIANFESDIAAIQNGIDTVKSSFVNTLSAASYGNPYSAALTQALTVL